MKNFFKHIQVVIVIVVGTLLSIWLFQTIDQKSHDDAKQRFISNATDRLFSIEKNIDSEIAALKSVVGLYAASENVNRAEFANFVDIMSQERNLASFQTIEWIPRIPIAERKLFDAMAKKDGLTNFRITERSEDGKLITAKKRQEYFAVYYIKPYEGNEPALGFDLASNPVQKMALEKARDTGQMVASGRINLVPIKEHRTAIPIYYPIYKKDEPHNTVKQRRQSLQGFVRGVMRVKSLVSGRYTASNSKTLNPMGIDFYAYDETESSQVTPIYIHHSRTRTDKAPALSLNKARTGNYLERVVRIGDRQWRLIARPIRSDFGYTTLIQNWILLFFSLLFTALSSAYLFTLSSRTRTVMNLVNKRTDELRESEVKQRSILETAADAIITINEKGIIQSFNLAAEKIFGYPAAEAIGSNVSMLLPEDKQTAHQGYVDHSTLGAPRIINPDSELYGLRKDGTEFPMELNIAPMELARERGFVGVLRDITDRKQAQQVLSQFKTTLDKTMDCVFMFHPDTLNFFYVNAGAMQQVGYSYDEMLDMTPFDIKHDFDEERFRAFIAPMIAGSQSVMNFETLHRHKDGHDVPVEIFLQYIDPPEEAPRFVAIVRDISERKRIDKMKNEFISTVSHELRTPLTSIRGSLGLINGGAVGELPVQANEMLKIASNNTQRLLLLINDILDIQKIESGEMDFKFQSVELMPFIEKAIQDNAGYGEQHHVNFKIVQRLDNVCVSADPDRLMQVMSNLLSNAAKFSPEGDTVELHIAHHHDALRISIIDHGPGIPVEFQPKLFDKFTQADSTDTRKVGGTGLGLSITKAVVEKHGGHIEFASTHDVGTIFSVDLPEMKVA